MLKLVIFALVISAVYAAINCDEDCKASNKVCNQRTGVCQCKDGFIGVKCQIACNMVLHHQTEIKVTESEYNAHARCSWRNDPSMVTYVEVVRFDLEKHHACAFDYLKIHESMYCGEMKLNHMPRTFVLRDNDAIEFVTDQSFSAGGFTLKLTHRHLDDHTTERTTERTTHGNDEGTPVPNCPLKPVDGKPHFYLLGGIVRPCAEGTVFSLFKCTCIHENESNDL